MANATGLDLLMQTGGQMGLDANSMAALKSSGSQLADQFSSEFNNYVGRAPTSDELNKFYSQFLVPNATNGNYNQVRANPDQYLQSFLGTNFQQEANDVATQKLAGQNDEAQSLGNLFESQGTNAINDTQQSLLDYQSKLFDKLRPNLLTSLKSQGLLDTGGLNEAEAGVQGDLANQGANYIAQLRLNNAQGANQIRFGGASAPYYYKQGLITQQPQALSQAGQFGLTNSQNTFMSNLAYGQNMGLVRAQGQEQSNLQPSFLRTLGQSFAGGFGSQLGQGAGTFTNGSVFGSKQSPGGGASGASNAYAGALA